MSLSFLASARKMSDRQSENGRFGYKRSYNRESCGRSVNRNPLRIMVGPIGIERTLLNAINPNLSRASYSWKKCPAFLTTEGQQLSGFSKSYPRRFGQDSDSHNS